MGGFIIRGRGLPLWGTQGFDFYILNETRNPYRTSRRACTRPYAKQLPMTGPSPCAAWNWFIGALGQGKSPSMKFGNPNPCNEIHVAIIRYSCGPYFVRLSTGSSRSPVLDPLASGRPHRVAEFFGPNTTSRTLPVPFNNNV